MNIRMSYYALRVLVLLGLTGVPAGPAQSRSGMADHGSAPPIAGSTASNAGFAWLTFLGGMALDSTAGIAVDASGNTYITGVTDASWGSPLNPLADMFVAKVDGEGALIWNTFLGGIGQDSAAGIAVDGSGDIYITGASNASWGTPLEPFAGSGDAFAAKLNSEGALIWNTFLGGAGLESAGGIAVDGSGNIYLTGASDSTWGTPLDPFAGSDDAYVVQLDSSGAIVWNTFLGGSADDSGHGIAVDGSGNVYITGASDTSWGTPIYPFGTEFADAFAAKLEGTGALAWNTFLGGHDPHADDADGTGIAVDQSGNLYIIGTQGVFLPEPLHENHDGFVVRLDSTGAFTWNAILGSSDYPPTEEWGSGIAVSANGGIYAIGTSYASWGTPLTPFAGISDAYVAQLNSSGAIVWNTFLGGRSYDRGRGIGVDGNGNVYVTGTSEAGWGAPVRPYAGSEDGFATKLGRLGIFRSIGSHDGWVLESSETSDLGGTMNATAPALIVGDDNENRQYRSILSFNTASLPDNAIIMSVTLKIKKAGLVGINPFTTHQNIMADLYKGTFSGNPLLEINDFQSPATRSGAMMITNTPIGGWYSGFMSAPNSVFINKQGLSQLRLRFRLDDNDDRGADYLKFYSGNAATAGYRPQLIIQYYLP